MRADRPQSTLILSGTGSGKTECVPVPIVDACIRQPDPGVKAVIVYPMNALANNQLKRLTNLLADGGYDHDCHRRRLRARGITPLIGRRRSEHGSDLGAQRWVVERSYAWLHSFRRLLVRHDRRADIHEAFLSLACCVICFRRLRVSL